MICTKNRFSVNSFLCLGSKTRLVFASRWFQSPVLSTHLYELMNIDQNKSVTKELIYGSKFQVLCFVAKPQNKIKFLFFTVSFRTCVFRPSSDSENERMFFTLFFLWELLLNRKYRRVWTWCTLCLMKRFCNIITVPGLFIFEENNLNSFYL